MRGKLLHDTGAYTLQDPNIPYNSASTMSGPYIVPGAVDRSHHRHEQQDAGVVGARRRLSAGGVRDGAAARSGRARDEARPRRGAAAQSHPGRARCRTSKPLKARSGAAMEYDSGDYPACQARCSPPPAGTISRQRQAEARARRPLSRHRPRAWREGHRPRPVRVGPRADFAHRQGHRVHRRVRDGPGPRHRDGADRRRAARRQRRQGQGGGGRHRGRVARPRRLRQPADRDRRLVGASCGARRSPTRRRRSRATFWKPPSTISNWSTARCAWSARRSSTSSSARSRASCRARRATAFRPASIPASKPTSMPAPTRCPTPTPATSPRSRSTPRPAR